MLIIDDILLAPISGFKFILRQIQQLAERELNDESVIKERLLELEMRRELDEISEEEYTAAQAELFARLRAIRLRQIDDRAAVHIADSSSSLVIETPDEDDPLRGGSDR